MITEKFTSAILTFPLLTKKDSLDNGFTEDSNLYSRMIYSTMIMDEENKNRKA